LNLKKFCPPDSSVLKPVWATKAVILNSILSNSSFFLHSNPETGKLQAMPTITRWYLKTSLLYLGLALLLGALQAAAPLLRLPAFFSLLNPAYFHLFMLGWVAQLIFGIAIWMFPKFSRQQPRGNELLNWIAFGLLNVGLLLRLIAEPLNALQPQSLWGPALAVSAGLQWLAGLTFVINTWPRVKER
jgi:hypothetical protein